MKLKRIVVAIGTMGTVGVSPAWAADYDHTVDLASQMIVAGDVVNTSDLIGITARGAGTQPLALGTGAITVTVTATDTANARVMGLDLGDGKVHDLGQGSEVNVKDVNADRIVRGIVVSGRSRLGAEGLKVNVDMPNSRGTGMAIESNSRVDDLGSHSQINVTGRIAIGLELGTSGQFKAQKLDMKLAGQAQSIGARVGSSGILNLGSGSSIVAQGTQGSSNGLLVMGNGANITADALNLEISGVGVDINSGYATIDLGQNSSISTTGMGIFMSGSANSSTLNASGLTIHTTGDAAYGLNMNNGAKRVDLGTNSKITTTGQGATGVIVFNGDLTAQGLEVAVSGEQAVGMELFAGKHDLSQSRIITTDGGGLAAQSSNRKKVEVTFKQGLIDAGGRYGVHARLANSTVNLDQALVKVSRQGSDNYGLWALSGGTLNMKDSEIEATNGASGMLAGTGSVINLTGKNQVKSDQIALWSRGAEAKIEAQGALIIAGDVVAENQGKVSMTVADAYFKGGLLQKDEGTVHLKGERTIWDMTKSSTLTDLDLNQSQVNFPAVTQAKQYATLEVATLAGAGLFNMHTGIVEGESDKVRVTASSAGQHQVALPNQGSADTNGQEVITLIHTPDGEATFSLKNEVELGGYLYRLQKNDNDRDWSLVSSGLAPKPDPDPDPDPDPGPNPDPGPGPNPDPGPGPDPGPSITTTADAAANSMVAAYLANYVENQSLLKRLGDLRAATETQAVWTRAYGGKMDAFSSGLLQGFDMRYKGFQLGFDRQVFQNDDARLYLGAALGLLDSDQDYRRGSGSLKSYSAALYGTYLTDQQFYTDMVLKFARVKNEFDVRDSAHNHVDGDARANTVSLSAEVGQRFYLGPTQNQWYITPQAQLTLSRLAGMTHHGSNGLTVSVDNRHSVLGRVGTEIGYDLPQATNPTSIYAKVSFLREFSSSAEYALNNSKQHHSFKGNWWQFGVGVSSQINKRHHVFVDLESNQGQRFDQRQLNAGYRYVF